MNARDKLRILRSLNVINGKYQMMEFTLEMNQEDPAKIIAARKKLKRRIKDLRGQIHDKWTGAAGGILSNLGAASTKAQDALRAMDRDTKVAENVVKAVGNVDRVVETTKRLIT